ncbi:MAG: NAD-dependent epimerase/dehydratase family protein [bacterium]|nr:NAD-dependent epimerase/dehydratase family protein [bacterium]
MQILVTGGAGFIGSNIVDAYLDAGHEVVIVDNLSTGHRANLPKKAKFYEADICDLKTLEKIFKEESFDIVSHHAAQIDVRASVEKPQEDAQINIIGGINLLEMCRKYKIKKIIYAGTGGALYGEMENGKPSDEKSPVLSLSHYGTSKYALELYIQLYARLYGLDFTIFRYANVYGPRQNPKGEAGVVAIFINAMLEGKTPFIYGDGNQLRDYVYVKDVAQANLLALTGGKNETINIGSGKTTSVNQLFDLLKKDIGFIGMPEHKPQRPGEIYKSSLNVDYAKKVLDWSPQSTMEQALKETIVWQKANQKRGHP